ncbi:MAG: hypothetical protein AAF570_09160, partial [Bacteroidota bacterium]
RVFLASPFHNTRPEILVLYDAVRAEYPDFVGFDLFSETVFEGIWPGKSYVHARLKHLVSDLVGLLEEFWVVQGLKKNPVWRDKLLLDSYEGRALDKYFGQTLRAAKQRLSQRPYRDAAHFYARFLLESAGYAFAVKRKNRQMESGMTALLESLDTFYVGLKMRYGAAALTRAAILGEDAGLPLLAEVRQYAAQPPFSESPLVDIYHHILLTLETDDHEAAFEALLDLLQRHAAAFPRQERAEMYAFALNYCIRRLNEGAEGYPKRLFELYVFLAREQLIFEENQLSPQHYKNIVTLGLRLERFSDTEAFIADQSPFLPTDFRENSRRYSLASLHFARKAYGQALRTLQSVEFTDVFYHLDAKCLLLKTYYELQETEPLFSLVDTFRVYLRRNRKISDYQRTIYRNLVKYVKQLAKYRLDGKKSLEKIKIEIGACGQVADKAWLKRKSREL